MENQKPTHAKRTRNPDSKRTAIYEAAVQLFTNQGYENVSIAKIAKEAGIAVGTVYRFHDTKLTLLRAMLEEVEDAFVTRMESDWACDGTYAERIEGMCHGIFAVAEDNLNLLKLLSMTTDVVFTDGSLPGDRIQNQIRIMYTEGVNVGASHQGDPYMMAAIAHGMVEGAMVRWMRLGAPKDIDAASQLALVFKDGFMTKEASQLS